MVDPLLLTLLKPVVGLDDDDAVGMIGTAGRPWLRALVNAALATEGLTGVAPGRSLRAHEAGRQRARPPPRRDAPLAKRGIPTVFFCSGESADYHEPTDTIEGLEWPLMARRTRAIAALVESLSSTPIPAPAPTAAP